MESLMQTQSTVILVAEETGWGIVPDYSIGRLFRDRLGYLTRQIGTIADGVYLVVAGYALNLRQVAVSLDKLTI
jgi:adenosylcobinamide kinase/adenosylcobinamide-phosphate guanylyltransferase